jgi:hypothetical protein
MYPDSLDCPFVILTNTVMKDMLFMERNCSSITGHETNCSFLLENETLICVSALQSAIWRIRQKMNELLTLFCLVLCNIRRVMALAGTQALFPQASRVVFSVSGGR